MRIEGPFFVYILKCSDGSYYVGSTSDPAQRLQSHQSGGGATYTAQRLPVSLAYQESHSTLEGAAARERQIKRWTRDKKTALIAGNTGALQSRSRRRKFRPEDPV